MALSDLRQLHPDQWDTIRDIYIPLAPSDDEATDTQYVVNDTLLEDAIAYTGGNEPFRLYSPDHPESIRRLIKIFMESDARLQRVDKFRIEHDGFAFRAQRMMTIEGPVLELRSLPRSAPALTDLNMPASCRALLLDTDLLHGGLFLVCATNGQGKTTTCSATVKSRLQAFAGIACSIEDPPELPLSGFHGKGRCYQIPADLDDADAPGSGYAKALLKSLRFFATMPNGGSILFVGEVRDPRTAAETLLAAANGHLVLATIHAHSITAALTRLTTLAQATNESMPSAAVQQLLAETLRGVIHQNLTFRDEGSGWSRGQLRCGVLSVAKNDSRTIDNIRSANWTALSAQADQQRKTMNEIEDELNTQLSRITDPAERLAAQNKITAFAVKDRLKGKP